MKSNHKSIKKFISLILTAAFLIAAVSVFSVSAEDVALLSDSGYSALDLSLTKTVYNAIGQTGQVKAAVIQAMDVEMYATPYYSTTSTSNKEAANYYAVKVDKDTHDYLRKDGVAKKTFTARPQRVMLSADQLVYSSDDTSVATVNTSGLITITGYGIANISVTYNAGTPSDSSDDVTGAVTIFATQPDGNITTIDNTLQWTDESHSALEMRINAITDSSVGSILEAGNNRFGPAYLTSAFDPIGDDSSPLTMQVTADGSVIKRVPYVSAETLATGDTSLIAQEYAAGSRIMMQGWYYESGKGTSSSTVYPKLTFGYCGTTDISSYVGDGRRAWQIGNKNGGKYRIWGGDANTYSTKTYLNKDANPSGVTTTSASATNNPSGIDTVVSATKGWHQFAMTVEPSLINPGTDYLLTKVYLDGILMSSQDIYVGDIDIAKRRFFIYLPKLKNATGQSSDTAGAGNDYIHYKGLCIARFDSSETVVDSIPSDSAQNVPLYQTIKVKLGKPIENVQSAGITLNGLSVSNAVLDESKTVITIKPGKLLPDKQYVLYVAGERVIFRTSSDDSVTNMLEDMKTYGYSITEARSFDFADSSKSAEEYGVGFMRPAAKQIVTVSDGVATFEEGKRSSVSSTDAGANAVIVRNLMSYDSEPDRVVISYKVKLNVPSTYTGDTAYAFTNGDAAHAGGIGVPIIAKKSSTRAYNPIVRSVLANGDTSSTSTSLTVPQTTGGVVTHTLLKNNTGSGMTAYNMAGVAISNHRISQTSLTTWRHLVYVVDFDQTGKNAPTWYFVDDNSASKTLNSENAIYKLEVPAAYGAGYTWIDSLYIPVTSAKTSVSAPTSFSIKDVEIYSLSRDVSSQIENEILVNDSTTSEVVYADSLSGKTVDVTVNGHIGAGSTVIFAAYNKANGNMRLESVKSIKTTETKTSVTLENFSLPQGDDVQLCVFVWNSLADKKSYETKYVYNLTE